MNPPLLRRLGLAIAFQLFFYIQLFFLPSSQNRCSSSSNPHALHVTLICAIPNSPQSRSTHQLLSSGHMSRRCKLHSLYREEPARPSRKNHSLNFSRKSPELEIHIFSYFFLQCFLVLTIKKFSSEGEHSIVLPFRDTQER